jgi:hypothetical protein
MRERPRVSIYTRKEVQCVLIVLSRRNYTNDGRNNKTGGERVRLRDKERALSAAFHCFEVFSLPAVRAYAAAACVRRVFLAPVDELQFVLREREEQSTNGARSEDKRN